MSASGHHDIARKCNRAHRDHTQFIPRDSSRDPAAINACKIHLSRTRIQEGHRVGQDHRTVHRQGTRYRLIGSDIDRSRGDYRRIDLEDRQLRCSSNSARKCRRSCEDL